MMPVLPDENVQIVKINESQFYRAKTASTMVDVAAIKEDIVRLEALIAERYALLEEGAAHGVGDAAAAVSARKG